MRYQSFGNGTLLAFQGSQLVPAGIGVINFTWPPLFPLSARPSPIHTRTVAAMRLEQLALTAAFVSEISGLSL